jgi:2-polyprenyl-3-methyl-5-hydroxy-6-metoxy-1,4-benzoquinol methylase
MFEKVESCPVCESKLSDNLIICQDHTVSKESFAISRCRTCSFLYTNPRPSEDRLGSYYESEDYISHNKKSKSLINRIYKIARKFTVRSKVAMINKFTANKNTLLDIGCGTGEFINEAKKNNWLINAVEPGSLARRSAEELNGISIYEDIQQITKTKFDAITMFHVLEHVADLNGTLKKVRKLLHKEGSLFIALPNSASYDAKQYKEDWAAYDVPRHLYHFNQETAELLFKKHNLEIIETLPMKLDAFYVSLLSEKYANGKTNYWQAFWKGLKSNKWAKNNQNNYSSLIYVLQKR